LNTSELFDIQAGTFASSALVGRQARFGAATTLINNGNVLLAGGFDGVNLNPFGKIYSSGSFNGTGNNLNTPRYQATATLLNNGEVLVAGGSTCAAPGCPSNAAERYNPVTNLFTA